MNIDLNSEVVNKVAFYINKAKEIFPNHQINMPEVTFDVSRVKVAGTAYGIRKVSFNVNYFTQEDFWKTTIGHEVAHIVTKIVYPHAKQAHGPEFRHVMNLFGLDGRTYHSMVVNTYLAKYKYEYSCGCGKIFNLSSCIHKKVQNGQNRICKSCKGRIKFIG